MAGELTDWTPGAPNGAFPTKVNSYESLLHVFSNGPLTAVLQKIVDGLGNDTGITISTLLFKYKGASVTTALAPQSGIGLTFTDVLLIGKTLDQLLIFANGTEQIGINNLTGNPDGSGILTFANDLGGVQVKVLIIG